jgi:hypothetical protein
MEMRKKRKVHKLTDDHCANRKTNCRKLYERHLAKDRSEYVVTLDESYIYLSYCNGISKICYVQRGEQTPEEWVNDCKENFPIGFMIVGALTGRGPLPLIRVPPKVKMSAKYYVDFVLKPLLEVELPKLYPNEVYKVYLHHDKCTSHTAAFTQEYLQNLQHRTAIDFIKNEEIPVKSPDASPMDFFGFRYLKQKLSRRHATTTEGVWKLCNSIWSTVGAQMTKKVFDSWKRRCCLIGKGTG